MPGSDSEGVPEVKIDEELQSREERKERIIKAIRTREASLEAYIIKIEDKLVNLPAQGIAAALRSLSDESMVKCLTILIESQIALLRGKNKPAQDKGIIVKQFLSAAYSVEIQKEVLANVLSRELRRLTIALDSYNKRSKENKQIMEHFQKVVFFFLRLTDFEGHTLLDKDYLIRAIDSRSYASELLASKIKTDFRVDGSVAPLTNSPLWTVEREIKAIFSEEEHGYLKHVKDNLSIHGLIQLTVISKESITGHLEEAGDQQTQVINALNEQVIQYQLASPEVMRQFFRDEFAKSNKKLIAELTAPKPPELKAIWAAFFALAVVAAGLTRSITSAEDEGWDGSAYAYTVSQGIGVLGALVAIGFLLSKQFKIYGGWKTGVAAVFCFSDFACCHKTKIPEKPTDDRIPGKETNLTGEAEGSGYEAFDSRPPSGHNSAASPAVPTIAAQKADGDDQVAVNIVPVPAPE